MGTPGEGDPAYADRPGVTEPGGKTMLGRCAGELARGEACLGPRGAALDIDVNRLHVGEVGHDAPVVYPVGQGTVATAAHGELETGLGGVGNDASHVIGACDTCYRPVTVVDPTGEHLSRLVIPWIVGRDDPADQGVGQMTNRVARDWLVNSSRFTPLRPGDGEHDLAPAST